MEYQHNFFFRFSSNPVGLVFAMRRICTGVRAKTRRWSCVYCVLSGEIALQFGAARMDKWSVANPALRRQQQWQPQKCHRSCAYIPAYTHRKTYNRRTIFTNYYSFCCRNKWTCNYLMRCAPGIEEWAICKSVYGRGRGRARQVASKMTEDFNWIVALKRTNRIGMENTTEQIFNSVLLDRVWLEQTNASC